MKEKENTLLLIASVLVIIYTVTEGLFSNEGEEKRGLKTFGKGRGERKKKKKEKKRKHRNDSCLPRNEGELPGNRETGKSRSQ